MWTPGRGPEGPEKSRLTSGPGRPRWLTHCSLAPSLRAVRPPAGSLLPGRSLARPPGFRRSRRKLRHSQSPRLLRGCARALRSRDETRVWMLLPLGRGEVKRRAVGNGALRTEPPKDSETVRPSLLARNSPSPKGPQSLQSRGQRRRAPVT